MSYMYKPYKSVLCKWRTRLMIYILDNVYFYKVNRFVKIIKLCTDCTIFRFISKPLL